MELERHAKVQNWIAEGRIHRAMYATRGMFRFNPDGTLSDSRLVKRLCASIEAGLLDIWTAEQVYEREARVLPRWCSLIFGSPLYPSLAFVMADNRRVLKARLSFLRWW